MDKALVQAKQYPHSFMLSQPAIFALDVDGHSRDLIITSARDEHGNPITVRVPSRKMQIFRADGFELHWRFRDKPGSVKLNKSNGLAQLHDAGEIVMVVRDDETVRCYTMTYDLRC